MGSPKRLKKRALMHDDSSGVQKGGSNRATVPGIQGRGASTA